MLWALVLAYVVQSLLLMVPGPVTQVPVWFTRAIYRESSSVQLGPDSGAFWLYNVVSETMAEGFGIMLLHKFPSPEAFGSTLRYAVLYAAVASSVATLGYNWEGLGLEETTQDATDVAFLAVPCALYAALLVQFSALSARRSLGVYAVFCVAWRGALLCALLLADRSSPATAVVSMIRNLATPFVMYYTLVRDTDYWCVGEGTESLSCRRHDCSERAGTGVGGTPTTTKTRPMQPRSS